MSALTPSVPDAPPTATPMQTPTPPRETDPPPDRPSEESLAAIEALRWVDDDLTSYERMLKSALTQLARRSEDVFEKVIRKTWTVESDDDPHRSEWLVLKYLDDIARGDEAIAADLLEMPFMDSVQYADVVALETFGVLAQLDPSGLEELVQLDDIADRLTDDETASVALLYLGLRASEAMRAIRSLPWTGNSGRGLFAGDDLLTPSAIRHLQKLALDAAAAFWALLEAPWVEGSDGVVSSLHVQMIDHIATIGSIDPDASLALLGLPVLESFEESDLAAVGLIRKLFYEDHGGASRLLSDPALLSGL